MPTRDDPRIRRLGRCLSALVLLTVAAAATTPPPPQEPVNFNHPPREYVERSVCGWTVWVEKELAVDHADLAEQAVGRLDASLTKMLAALPPRAHPRLKRLRLFLMLGKKAHHGGRNNGAEYFARIAPQFNADLDPRMADSILIYSAENYVWLSDFWALKVLVHEFAHAWQLEQWPEEQPDILAAYRQAMSRGLYRNVRREDGVVLEKAYATANQLEYFAELSCAYFVGCDYQPCDVEALRSYDPVGHAMIRKMWGLEAAEPCAKVSGPGTDGP